MRFFTLLSVVGLAVAAPRLTDLGVTFENGPDGMPLLKLGYSTYRATVYDKPTDVYTFKNIRFAAPPVGELRWQPPAPPLQNDTIQDGSIDGRCIEAPRKKPLVKPYKIPPMQEDCLFLDLEVPGVALKDPSMKLPIVVWIYGGGYVSGYKEEYTYGNNVVANANNKMIFIQGNYRMGAYGFLGGTVVEKNGIANAGFWDSRAVFEWAQKYAPLFGGDPKDITAWGQSAGAGTIMNMLVLDRGQLDPIFVRAIMMSPAFYFEQDRKGKVTKQMKKFAGLAGCEGEDLVCLRKATPEALLNASNIINTGLPPGLYAFGPCPDNKHLKQLAQLEYAEGNYWPNLQSIISSHVMDESQNFVDHSILTDEQFVTFLNGLVKGAAGTPKPGASPDSLQSQAGPKLIAAVTKQYPPLSSPEGKELYHDNEQNRLKAFIRDVSFTCNNRVIDTAYPNTTYSFKYAIPPGTHGSELDPLFYNQRNFANDDAANPDKNWMLGFQSYWSSYSITGDPNKLRDQATTIPWGFSDATGQNVTGVLQLVGNSKGPSAFDITVDDQLPKDKCHFWFEVEKQLKTLALISS